MPNWFRNSRPLRILACLLLAYLLQPWLIGLFAFGYFLEGDSEQSEHYQNLSLEFWFGWEWILAVLVTGLTIYIVSRIIANRFSSIKKSLILSISATLVYLITSSVLVVLVGFEGAVDLSPFDQIRNILLSIYVIAIYSLIFHANAIPIFLTALLVPKQIPKHQHPQLQPHRYDSRKTLHP